MIIKKFGEIFYELYTIYLQTIIIKTYYSELAYSSIEVKATINYNHAMRLFVFDVDGTLVGRDQILKEDVKNSLNKILDNGDALAIASGRPYPGIIKYLSQLHKGNKFCICANGSEVKDEDGVSLMIDALSLKDYYQFVQEHQNIFHNDEANIYAYTSEALGYLKHDKFIDGEVNCNGNFHAFDLSKQYLPLDYPILKFMISSSKTLSIEYEKEITEEERKKYRIVRSSPIYIEFISKTADKAYAVKFLKDYLKISNDDVYTFGDSGNDYLMIKDFNGIAMGNAIQECKDVAKFITKSVDEGGVVFALENFVK